MNLENVLESELSKSDLLALIRKQKDTIYALEHSDRQYKNLFENSIDGIYKSTVEGKFIDVNISLVKMLGYSSKEELLAVDINTQLYFNYEERKSVIKQGDSDRRKIHRIRKKDGTSIWVEDYVKRVSDDNGNVLFFEGIIRDVSQIIKAKKIQKVLLKISKYGYKSKKLKDLNEFIKILR